MRSARRLLIFSYGLFTIAAQTLLFREFITTFEGNDISVGIFFGSWFFWIALGALLVYRTNLFAQKLLENIELLLLLFLPAFVLQTMLIIQARQLAGIESYARLSISTILFLSILVNAPVSIITGMLFPIACRWVQQDKKLPVSHVYIIEAAGSFIGGLGTTVFLALGVTSAKVFFILAFVVSLSAFVVQLAKAGQCSDPILKKSGKIKTKVLSLIPLCVLLCFFIGADKTIMRYSRVVKWTKLLPGYALIGSFQTAQAEYLYGIYHSQWMAIREGSTCETLPDEATAGRIAAIALCQNPNTTRALVVGSGLGLCRQLLRLPQVEHITWAHYDSEYVRKVNTFIPPELKIADKRLHYLAGDVRSLLAQNKQYFDMVILNLPDATSSVLNRYYTLQFYRQIKESLKPDGILAVRTTGGENIMGTELINLGASTKLTLEKVFPQLVLAPGDETWFIASDSQNLTGDPGKLQDRFAAIKDANNIFPPHGLLSVYLPDRAAAALENYSGADLPQSLLINRDSRPLTNLYSLLLTAKLSGAPSTKFAKNLILAGPAAFLIPLLVFIILRLIYVLKSSSQGSKSSFNSAFLVFSAGWVAIGVVIVLMYLYQTRFGSLYLHVGVISSLFMVGLTAGAALIRRLLLTNENASSQSARPQILLFAVIFVHMLTLAAIASWPLEEWTHLIFAIAFVLSGICVGGYFPLAASQLADSAFETGQAGSKLETADHIGASAGGLLTGLLLVPVLGPRATLLVFITLILANTPLAALKIYQPEKLCSFDTTAFRLRRLGYILFGIGLSIVLASNLLDFAGSKLRPSLPPYAAQALAGQSHLQQLSTTVGDTARKINYFKVYQPIDVPQDSPPKENLAGYIFSSEDLAPQVSGFGGRMNLAIYVNTTGKLINFHIIRSNETPSYLDMLSQWRALLNGRQLFVPQPFTDVHAVTGATVSSKAVLSALQTSAHAFATQILHQTLQPAVGEKIHRPNYVPDTPGIYLIIASALSLIVIFRGGFWSRLAVLLFNFIAGGIILNAQYSSEQIATILSLHTPAAGLSGAFLLVVGIPVLVLIFGNIYCGYICPFGAAQELLGCITLDRFKQPLSTETVRKARFVKYAVLLVLIIVFFLSRDRTTLTADPLIGTFNFQSMNIRWQSSMLLMVMIALIGSLFYTRFWCRYLCPAGAFLSLLNNVAILKRYLPAKRFGRCEFCLTAKDQTDCLYCDRCRYQAKAVPAEEYLPRPQYAPAKPLPRYFLAGVLVIAGLVAAVSVNRFLVVSASLTQPPISASSAGQPRNLDLQRVRTMIEQKRLSDKEAQFYKKVEPSPPKVTDKPQDKRQDN